MSVIISCTVIIHICICRHCFSVTLLPNFDYFLCLRIKYHKSLILLPILAAGGPYWVFISQKVGSLLGPYFKAWGSLLVFGTVLWAFEQINYGLRLCFMSSLTDKFDSLSTCCQNTENRDPSFKVLIP